MGHPKEMDMRGNDPIGSNGNLHNHQQHHPQLTNPPMSMPVAGTVSGQSQLQSEQQVRHLPDQFSHGGQQPPGGSSAGDASGVIGHTMARIQADLRGAAANNAGGSSSGNGANPIPMFGQQPNQNQVQIHTQGQGPGPGLSQPVISQQAGAMPMDLPGKSHIIPKDSNISSQPQNVGASNQPPHLAQQPQLARQAGVEEEEDVNSDEEEDEEEEDDDDEAVNNSGNGNEGGGLGMDDLLNGDSESRGG